MCNDCFTDQIYRFETQKDFESFDIIFTRKCFGQKLKAIEPKVAEQSTIQRYVLYRCVTCSEVWALSVPDYAWRGFFLSEADCIKYLAELDRNDKMKKIGLSIVLVIAVAFSLWKVTA